MGKTYQRTKKLILKIYSPQNFKYLVLIIFFTLIYRILTLEYINNGGDAANYWFSAKQILGRYPELTHQTTRWGIIIPTAIIQSFFSTNAVTYYILPIVSGVLTSIFSYLLTRRFTSPIIATLTTISLVIFPPMIMAGSQILPGGFSALYILLATYFITIYFQNKKEQKLNYLILSAVFLFLAYLTKITNLFYFPGFALVLFLSKKDRKKNILIFLGTLGILFFGEYLIYLIFNNSILGRFSIVNGTYGYSGRLKEISFFGLFQRYTSLGLSWKALLVTFFSSLFYIGYKKKLSKYIIIISTAGSFLFFMTFTVKSLDPLVPATLFNPRYLNSVIPLLVIFCGIALSLFLKKLKLIKTFNQNKSIKNIIERIITNPTRRLLLFCIAILLTISWQKQIFINPLIAFNTHPIIKTYKFSNLLTFEYNNGTFLLSTNQVGKDLFIFNRILLAKNSLPSKETLLKNLNFIHQDVIIDEKCYSIVYLQKNLTNPININEIEHFLLIDTSTLTSTDITPEKIPSYFKESNQCQD